MRHRVDHRKLGRTAAHRRAMLRNMVTSLFAAERISTTDAKAKEARRLAERLITRAKKGHAAHKEGLSLKEAGKTAEAQEMAAVALNHWRQASRYVRKTRVLKKLFEEIAPHFLERPGGYTRMIKMEKNRLGDNARTVILELVDTKITSAPMGVKEEAEEGKKGKGKAKAKTEAKTEAKTKTKTKAKAEGKSKAKAKPKAAAQ